MSANTVDLHDRRFLAQCTENLSSSALAALLDLLLMNHPSEVVERKGGDSYHIDFGTLSPEAYAIARKFIKQALKDDDELPDISRQDSISSLPVLPSPAPSAGSSNVGYGYSDVKESESVSPEPSIPKSELGVSNRRGSMREDRTEQKSKQQTESNATPVLPYPSSEAPQTTSSTLDSITVSPEKSSSRLLKRQRRSSPESVATSSSKEVSKKEESRYYNGDRIWRKPNDSNFSFHGVNVKLLGTQVDTNRPWICLTCSKAFVSKDKIVNHVQQHSGEKLHECPTCHGRFSSKHYLKEHEKRVHQFDCHQCEEIFSSFEELHEHSLKAHPQLESKNCSCKKGCNNSRCSCFKNGLNCTPDCLCTNCNNMA